MRILICFIGFSLASCGVYRTHFDCPAGKGIGCAPVTEVLDMIVERENGEDLFITDLGTALLLKQEEQKKISQCGKKLRLVKDNSGAFVMEDLGEE